MEKFFDVHIHSMNFSAITFSPLIKGILQYKKDYLQTGFLSPSYFKKVDESEKTELDYLQNTLSLYETSIYQNFKFIRDDLYNTSNEKFNKTFMSCNGFEFRGKVYKKYVLCPQCIDFSSLPDSQIYYKKNYIDKITPYAEETLGAINDFLSKNDDFEIYPFLGISPQSHTLEEIKVLIKKFLKREKNSFYGIKFYPPTGMNPYPHNDESEWKKVEYIYEYCCSNDIPIVLHCDSLGFRTISAQEAWDYTSPFTWEKVLKIFPNLKLDFAHFGLRYDIEYIKNIKGLYQRGQNSLKYEWTNKIIDLMNKYPNVYSDLSYSFLNKYFISYLHDLIMDSDSKSKKKRTRINNFFSFKNQNNKILKDLLKNRILFGTDFSIIALRLNSYNSCIKLWSQTPFSDEELNCFASVNPARFLGL